MPYRILMIAPTSFFGDYGCHVRILEETLALQKRGHQVLIVTYPLGRNLPDLQIERTVPPPWHANYEVGSSRHKIVLDVLLAIRVLRAARRFKPDVVHAHLHEGALIGALVSRLSGAPLVFDFQGSLTGEMIDHHFLNPNGMFLRPMHALEKWIDHLPSRILTSATNQAHGLVREYGVPAQKISSVPDAVNPQWFRPAWVEREESHERFMKAKSFIFGIPPERPVVVYLGLLADYQGVGVLVEAAAQVLARGLDAHFLIMGYPGVEHYATRARELGIQDRVSFPGRIPYEEAPRWLALGDIAVAPKMSATEGNGKILNYMATGLPVVAFDNPVSRDYLDDAGVYAPPGDVNGLASALENLLREPERARALGRRLRQRAIEKFAWEHTVHKIEQVYEALLKEPAAFAEWAARDLS